MGTQKNSLNDRVLLSTKTQSMACLIADPRLMSSVPARSHTFVEIDNKIISTVILLPLIQELQAKVCARSTAQEKNVVS